MKLNYAFNIGEVKSVFQKTTEARKHTEERKEKSWILMNNRFKFMFGTTIFHLMP